MVWMGTLTKVLKKPMIAKNTATIQKYKNSWF